MISRDRPPWRRVKAAVGAQSNHPKEGKAAGTLSSPRRSARCNRCMTDEACQRVPPRGMRSRIASWWLAICWSERSVADAIPAPARQADQRKVFAATGGSSSSGSSGSRRTVRRSALASTTCCRSGSARAPHRPRAGLAPGLLAAVLRPSARPVRRATDLTAVLAHLDEWLPVVRRMGLLLIQPRLRAAPSQFWHARQSALELSDRSENLQRENLRCSVKAPECRRDRRSDRIRAGLNRGALHFVLCRTA